MQQYYKQQRYANNNHAKGQVTPRARFHLIDTHLHAIFIFLISFAGLEVIPLIQPYTLLCGQISQSVNQLEMCSKK